MQTLKLVAVSAGLSSPSSTRLLADRLAKAAQERLTEQEYAVEVQVVELRDVAVDIARTFVTGFPSAWLQEAIDAVTGADGVIAVTPVFTASYSGLFKSFFDLIDPAVLTGKPVTRTACRPGSPGPGTNSPTWSRPGARRGTWPRTRSCPSSGSSPICAWTDPAQGAGDDRRAHDASHGHQAGTDRRARHRHRPGQGLLRASGVLNCSALRSFV